MKHLRSCPVSSLLLIWACGHAGSATEPAAHPTQQPVAHVRPAPAPAQPHEATEEDTSEMASEESVKALMFQHFEIVTFARDCVVIGNLDAIRTPLRAIAEHDYRGAVPDLWLPFVAQLQDAARITSQAENLTFAADGIARMGQVCGDCHASVGTGPKLESVPMTLRRKRRDSLDERMARHTWAADRMWLGLVVPSDEQWQLGAKALAEAPSALPTGAGPLVSASQLHALQRLGKRALDARSSFDRADTYGTLLSTCADCHSVPYQRSASLFP